MLTVASSVRLLARAGALISTATLLMFLLGGNESQRPANSAEIVGLLCFPTGVIVGLVWGWLNELVGGLIAIASLGLFYLWHVQQSGDMPGGAWFLLFTSPAFLFLVSWQLQQRKTVSNLG